MSAATISIYPSSGSRHVRQGLRGSSLGTTCLLEPVRLVQKGEGSDVTQKAKLSFEVVVTGHGRLKQSSLKGVFRYKQIELHPTPPPPN